MQRVKRSDKDGLWHASPSPPPPPSPVRTPQFSTSISSVARALRPNGVAVNGPRMKPVAPVQHRQDGARPTGRHDGGMDGVDDVSHSPELPPAMLAAGVAASISSSLVMVSFDIPHLVRRGCCIYRGVCTFFVARKPSLGRNRHNTNPPSLRSVIE